FILSIFYALYGVKKLIEISEKYASSWLETIKNSIWGNLLLYPSVISLILVPKPLYSFVKYFIKHLLEGSLLNLIIKRITRTPLDILINTWNSISPSEFFIKSNLITGYTFLLFLAEKAVIDGNRFKQTK